jgi:tetratricopeptide (TPR) repeat protein
MEMADPWMHDIEELRGGWRVHQDRGVRLFQEGKFEEAITELDLAAAAAPGEPAVQVNRGSALTKLGRYAEAVEAYRAAIGANPREVMAHFNLGTLAARFGHDEEAVRHYEAALAADPADAGSHFNLGNALRRLGRPAEALPHYRAVIEANPANQPARQAEVFTLMRLGRWKEATERIEQALTTAPEDKLLRNILVRVLAAAPAEDVRDGRRALQLGDQLTQSDPGVGSMLAYAMAAAEVGEWDKALEIQAAALEAAKKTVGGKVVREIEQAYLDYKAKKAPRVPIPESDPLMTPPRLPPPDGPDPWAG